MDNVIVPPWKKLGKIMPTKKVLDLSSAKWSNITFRNIITIPPLLTLTIIYATSMKYENLCIGCITTVKAVDTIHKDDASFPKSSISYRRIIQFLYPASHEITSLVISIPQDTGHVKAYTDEL